jgi:hypothetical protein
MWTPQNRKRYDRSQLQYPSDLTDAEWAGREQRPLQCGERPGRQFHAPICPKPAITLSRKDWHSYANRAVL